MRQPNTPTTEKARNNLPPHFVNSLFADYDIIEVRSSHRLDDGERFSIRLNSVAEVPEQCCASEYALAFLNGLNLPTYFRYAGSNPIALMTLSEAQCHKCRGRDFPPLHSPSPSADGVNAAQKPQANE